MADHSEGVRASLAGRYTIERELGRGGMATVYLARDLKHDRSVAVKVLRPELAALLGAERFLREIRLTAQLQHPHILTLIDSGEADGILFYVMPYVEGESLRQRLEREGQLPLDEALRITRAIASALDFAHRRGVIHRDIKPENVMLHEGEPMVADFGIALAVSAAGRERLTETGLSLGTPAYMSPEQATADPKVDGRSDQYSLASVLYEMLAGEPPYTGPTAQAIIAKRLTEPIPHLGTVRRVSPAVEAAVTQALAKAPADRFGTAGAFVAALTAGSTRATHPRWRTAAAALAAVIILGGVAAWLYASMNSKAGQNLSNVVPFTSSPGQKSHPVFSPGGNEIAYTWRGENDDNADIYVKLIGAGSPLRLTNSPAAEYCPAWSPDGRFIAFIRDAPAGERAAYYVIPALGGAERKIGEAYGQFHYFGRCMDWSLDGEYLIVADRIAPEDAGLSILLLSIEDGQRKVLVSQPAPYVTGPILSPDGSLVAYVQGAGFLAGDIHVVPVGGGPTRRLTFDGRSLDGLAWTADSKEIVFGSNRGGLWRLWRVASSGGTPELVNGVGEGATSPTISTRGNRLAYVQRHVDLNLWRMPGPGWKGRRPGPPAGKVIASSRDDDVGAFSPDGTRIAFESDRSGNQELWTSNSDGTNQTQLTALKAADSGSPQWSPDGKTIAFDARLEGHGDIFVISADGGSPHRLTTDPVENNVPTWSRDGKWIYFSSNRTGSWQIWKVPSVGGSVVQVTKNGGFTAQESPDAKFLYFFIGFLEGGTIWKMPVAGGEAVPVFQGVRVFRWWKIAPAGIYFIDGSTTPAPVRFFDFVTARVKTITSMDLGYLTGRPMSFDLSPDGQWILFTRVDQVESDVMLVENFR